MALPDEVRARMRRAALDPPDIFVNEVLFNARPWAFRNDPRAHEAFLREVGAKLGLPESSVTLIGSARLGFSLNRDHLLRPFQSDSDLDLVIVSDVTFDSTWNELLAERHDLRMAGSDQKRRHKKAMENISEGFIRPDQLPLGLALVRDWFPRLAGGYENSLARRHEVRAWLFRSLQHARHCYTGHIDRVQRNVAAILRARGDIDT